MRRATVVTAGATMVVASFLGPHIADAASRQDPRAEREQVRARQAEVAANLNADKASMGEIRDALNTLQANVEAQERGLRRAQDAVAAAEQREQRANAAVKKLTKKRKALSKVMARRAVSAYVAPPSDDVLSLLESSSMSEASSRHLYIELRAMSDSDLEDNLKGVDDDVRYQRRRAIAARELAEDKRAEQATRTEQVKAARAQQQQLAGSVQERIDDAVGESIRLAKTDRDLSAKIARQQALLAARLAEQREAARKAQAAAAARAQAAQAAASQAASTTTSSSSTSTSTSTTGAPLRSNGSESAPAVSSGPSYSSGGISLSTVGGITVNSQIAGQLRSMLSAASASGVHLSGGGYRDPSSQIALRKSHCGTSEYAIYSMPSSQCSPPTAPPGQSQHEVGLAIDFDNCSSRSTACYQWLAGHASSFGFYNLPSEPWHWSVNGH